LRTALANRWHHAPGVRTLHTARHFHHARRADVESLLDTLTALGHVEHTDAGTYAG
jgi:hypothetical protein